ncbi:UNVERIFIED_CONTAM: hypothetical protein FKN15_028078 [Acipenser sinensis]
MFSGTAFLVASALLVAAVQASMGPLETMAAPPIVHRKPFVVVWNMPTSRCQSKFGVTFDLAMFDIIENQQESFQGQNMTIFYRDSLGQYPYITPEGELTNGGVPQEVPIEKHLSTAKLEMEELLREDFSGLAVIDWEEWRPLWARNWGSMMKYRRVSEALVRLRHPELPEKKVRETAKMEFEIGARELMSRTLQLGSQLRPSGMWGYYKFPDCYNYNWKKVVNYTGRCHPKDPERNDHLAWLWRGSTALYPSIYLNRPLASSEKGALYVRYRVLEAMRVATSFASASGSLPVLPYARVAFTHSLKYLSQVGTSALVRAYLRVPYITPEGELTNGGVPQEVPIEKHLSTAKLEMEELLREDFSGLAVIDWEEWRPLWARNWGSMMKYRRVSEALVRLRHPELPEKKVRETAKMEFEIGARELMSRTLQLGSQLRPSGMWGYYKFPDCYNYNWKKVVNYTGRCHPKDPERNDHLAWLWRGSTALYPSIYLNRPLASSEKGALYVRYRVLEAMRVATSFASASGSLPVLPYARVAFTHSLKYLSQVGTSALHTCEELQEYVSGVLGRYVVNVTTAARQCSARLCSGNGRCARGDQNLGVRFHLSPYSFQIIPPPSPGRGAPSARGELSERDLRQLQDSFRCVCYRGWSGLRCQNQML